MNLTSTSMRVTGLVTAFRGLLTTNRVAAYSTKSIEERLGLPPKPKKPLTPYFRFMQEIRPNLIQKNPNTSLTDIVKIVAKKWEDVDETTKAKLLEAYQKDQIVYVEQRAKYDSKLTDDQKRDLRKMRQELMEAKERRAVRRRIKELGRPKKPASSFLKFIVQERSKADVTKQSYKEWHKKVCEKWTRLSEEEKEKLKAECRKDMEVYRQQISKWEEKMIRMGNIDVVRQESMIDTTAAAATKPKKITKPTPTKIKKSE